MFAGGPDICRKHGEEQNRKANRGRARSERDQQSDSSQDFEHACNGDNYCRSWEGGRDHTNQIGASRPPMGGGGDQKHHKKADAKRQIPIIQSRDTQQPRDAKNGEGSQQYDNRDHQRPSTENASKTLPGMALKYP